MYGTSQAYKEEQKQYLRNKSYVYVYIGIINQEAQASAYVSSDLADFASGDIFGEHAFEAYYATLEHGFTKVDGSFYFMPKNQSAALWQGAVSNTIAGGITFKFTGHDTLDIKGFSLDFGEYYPSTFVITNGKVSHEYTVTSSKFTSYDNFDGSEFITITPISKNVDVVGTGKTGTAKIASNGQGWEMRLRLMSVTCGVGLNFDNKLIMSSSRKTAVSHISEKLPSRQFDFTVDNTSKNFSKENPFSYLNYLEQGQEVKVTYGRELIDENGNSSIYMIPSGVTYLKTWTSNDKQATFRTVGYLDSFNGIYYKGKYNEYGTSAYQLAKDVCDDAGITNYEFDGYLKTFKIYNPLPVDSHKNCLQLIANAVRGIMYEDRDGILRLRTSFTPSKSINWVVRMDYFGKPSVLLTDNLATTYYATLERDYTRVDNHNVFMPRASGSYLETGFISTLPDSATTDNSVGSKVGTAVIGSGHTASGDGEIGAILFIDFETEWQFYGLNITFDTIYPKQIRILTFKEMLDIQDEFSYYPTSTNVRIEHDFKSCERIQIQFEYVGLEQRAHVIGLSFDSLSSYTVDYKDMNGSPQVSSIDKVKDIDVEYYNFGTNDKSDVIVSKDIESGNQILQFSEPCYDYSLYYYNKTSSGETKADYIAISKYGSYYVQFSAPRAGYVKLTGRKYIITNSTYTEQVNEIGETKLVSNILLNHDMAVDVGKWMKDYFHEDAEYNIQYRGEPAIDCDDQIYVENRFVAENLVRIEEETIDTAAGMNFTSKLVGRRISYKVIANGSLSFVGNVSLENGELEDGMFLYALSLGSQVIATVPCYATGIINFDNVVKYSSADAGKTYIYSLTQVQEADPYITYDSSTYEIKVQITSNGTQTLSVNYTITKNGAEVSPTWSNVNTPHTSISIGVPVTFTRKATFEQMSDGRTFEYQLKNGNTVLQTKAAEEGSVNFDSITYVAEDIGVHTYTVHDISMLTDIDNAPDVTAVVTVSKLANGDIAASVVYSSDILHVVNIIDGKVDIKAKTYIDMDTPEQTFSYGLYKDGELISTVSNSGSDVIFKDLAFDFGDVGVNTFAIFQTVPSPIDGYIYDTNTYPVNVTCVDNGTMEYSITVDAVPEFINYSDVSEDFIFSAGLVFIGGSMRNGQFTAHLIDSEGNTVATTTNQNGRFEWTTEIGADLLGNNEYTIIQDSRTDDNIAVGSGKLKFRVTMEDHELFADQESVTISNGYGCIIDMSKIDDSVVFDK